MPITRKQYEGGDFKQRSFGQDQYVLKFLKENKDKAFRADEIAKILKKSGSIIRQHLRKLLKRRLVERTVPYYIYSNKKKVSVKKKVKKKR